MSRNATGGTHNANGPNMRESVKAQSTSAQRLAMTERRMGLTNQIRKASRSRVLSLKRRLPVIHTNMSDPNLGASASSSSSQFASSPPLQLVHYFITAATSANTDGPAVLAALQSVVSRSTANNTSTSFTETSTGESSLNDVLRCDQGRLSLSLCNSLAESLVSSTSSSTPEMRLNAARVLTNLAAISPPPSSTIHMSNEENDHSYYGNSDDTSKERNSWCQVICQSNALTALIQCVSAFHSSQQQHNPAAIGMSSDELLVLSEQCAWALGNIAGDSQEMRDAVRQAGAIPALIGALLAGYSMASPENVGNRNEMVVGLCRNAAWALSNVARGESTPAAPFLSMNHNIMSSSSPSGSLSVSLLTPHHLAHLLTAPERLDPPPSPSFGNKRPSHANNSSSNSSMEDDLQPATWTEVANEVCWLLAFLTAREESAVDYLLESSSSRSMGRSTNELCQALACRLHVSSAMATAAVGVAHFSSVDAAIRMAIPCLRIVGNVATASDGQHVTSLLTANSNAHVTTTIAMGSDHDKGLIPQSLAQLISLGSSFSSISTGISHGTGKRRKSGDGEGGSVAAEASWAAGTLLVDAGMPLPHPSTASCHMLLPALCTVFTSGYAKLELKREAASALWNAVSEPPPRIQQDPNTNGNTNGYRNGDSSNSMMMMMSTTQDATLEIRDQILKQIAEWDGMIAALTGMLTCYDADAIHLALKLTNVILRRLSPNSPTIYRLFDEAGVADALESVCDQASLAAVSHGSCADSNADMAADLIDDFFDQKNDVVEDDNNNHDMEVFSNPFGPTSSSDTTTPSTYGFGTYTYNNSNWPSSNSGGSFNFGSSGSIQDGSSANHSIS